MRVAASLAHAAVTARRRKYRGIVLVAGLGENIEEPRGFLGRRKTWRPVSRHLKTRNVFQQHAGTTNILVEFRAALFVDQTMSIAVRRHLVSSGSGLFHQVGKTLGDPAQEKAGNLNVLFAEDVQQACKVLLHMRGQTGPLVDGGYTRVVQNMEPVLNVDRENGVLHGVCGGVRYITFLSSGTR